MSENTGFSFSSLINAIADFLWSANSVDKDAEMNRNDTPYALSLMLNFNNLTDIQDFKFLFTCRRFSGKTVQRANTKMKGRIEDEVTQFQFKSNHEKEDSESDYENKGIISFLNNF